MNARDRVPLVSVVVPTKGRPDLLRRCLAALRNQTLDPASFEVLVVDDGPDEATAAVVREAAASCAPRVQYLPRNGESGPAAARNLGWRSARARVVAFTDDDCLPARSWLVSGLDAMATGVAGACGQVIVPLPDKPTDHERNVAGLQGAEFVTANCFYRKDALEEVGGFDPRFRIAWREDSDVFFGMLERRLPLVYAPGTLVLHPVRRARWGVSVSHQRKNQFNALLYRKHPRLYRERIQSLPPLKYYVSVALLLGAAASASAGWTLAALAWLAGWIAMTAAFSIQRLRGASRAASHVAEMLVTSAAIPPVAVFWRLVGAARFRVPFL
jgi:glycosyltransferase involved in cell wall biosynthesis